ncbi:hypothetical protein [Streptomyces sp. NPDC050988]|uniref:hypothetical protein n=1 Tax=Streptomyces sp. NPDC050988 TaxID=3365637 RepID=UPI00378A9698
MQLAHKDVCQALGTGTEPRHVEGVRAELKRLVSRGILAESEPGLFVLPPTTRPASQPADLGVNGSQSMR